MNDIIEIGSVAVYEYDLVIVFKDGHQLKGYSLITGHALSGVVEQPLKVISADKVLEAIEALSREEKK